MYKCSVEIHRLSQNIFLEWMHLQHWATKLDTVKESLERQTAEFEAKKAAASAAASCGTPQVPTVQLQTEIIQYLLKNVTVITTKGGNSVHFLHSYTWKCNIDKNLKGT